MQKKQVTGVLPALNLGVGRLPGMQRVVAPSKAQSGMRVLVSNNGGTSAGAAGGKTAYSATVALPAGYTSVYIVAVGAGGGGVGGVGGGGGGGGCAAKLVTLGGLPAQYSVTTGAPGYNGVDGTSTTVTGTGLSTTLTGGGGLSAAGNTGGAGGTATGGTTNYSGGAGGTSAGVQRAGGGGAGGTAGAGGTGSTGTGSGGNGTLDGGGGGAWDGGGGGIGCTGGSRPDMSPVLLPGTSPGSPSSPSYNALNTYLISGACPTSYQSQGGWGGGGGGASDWGGQGVAWFILIP